MNRVEPVHSQYLIQMRIYSLLLRHNVAITGASNTQTDLLILENLVSDNIYQQRGAQRSIPLSRIRRNM